MFPLSCTKDPDKPNTRESWPAGARRRAALGVCGQKEPGLRTPGSQGLEEAAPPGPGPGYRGHAHRAPGPARLAGL